MAFAPPQETAHGQVVVAESGDGPFMQHVRMGRHLAVGDEPTDVGGQDRGPNPYEYLLAALGNCTSMTLRMYANLKKFPLERVQVFLSHRKIHAKDCAECENKVGMLDEIERRIELSGPLTDEQRQKLLEIANKCPVHRTLQSEIRIVTALNG
jgi:putative redox protein